VIYAAAAACGRRGYAGQQSHDHLGCDVSGFSTGEQARVIYAAAAACGMVDVILLDSMYIS